MKKYFRIFLAFTVLFPVWIFVMFAFLIFPGILLIMLAMVVFLENGVTYLVGENSEEKKEKLRREMTDAKWMMFAWLVIPCGLASKFIKNGDLSLDI